MRLMRLTPFGLTQLRLHMRETGSLPPKDAVGDYWVEPHPIDVDVTEAMACIEGWIDAEPGHDADKAIELHRAVRMPRRVAADGMVWPWLAAVAAPSYVLSRYPSDDGRLNVDRFGTHVMKNAFGRLWWGAEHSRVDEPHAVCEAVGLTPSDDAYEFTRRLFAQSSVHQELAYRHQLIDRTMLVAVLALVHRERLQATALRNVARQASLLFSTVLLDAYAADPVTPYAVDPEACRGALDLLRRTLGVHERPIDPTDAEEPTPVRSRTGLLRWLGWR